MADALFCPSGSRRRSESQDSRLELQLSTSSLCVHYVNLFELILFIKEVLDKVVVCIKKKNMFVVSSKGRPN